jgi:hypothetical protein
MFFGNFHAASMLNAGERLRAGSLGGGPSNWSYATMDYLQQNAVLFNVAYAAMLFWKEDNSDGKYTEFLEFCLHDLYKLRLLKLSGPCIDILHTTDHHRRYEAHADGVFIDFEKDTLGHYVITYNDGTTAELPIIYGLNIAHRKCNWSRTPGTDSYRVDSQLCGMAYGTLPIKAADDTYFLWRVLNPQPKKEIISITLKEKTGFEGKVEMLRATHGVYNTTAIDGSSSVEEASGVRRL